MADTPDTDDRAERARRALSSPLAVVDRQTVSDLLDAYDERLRVNVGLVADNALLRKQQREHTCGGVA